MRAERGEGRRNSFLSSAEGYSPKKDKKGLFKEERKSRDGE